jgi:mycothiol synthase
MTLQITETFRLRAATMADAQAVTDVINACSRAAIGKDETRIEEIQDGWKQPGFELDRDSRVAVNDAGEIIAYSAVWNRNEPHVRSWISFQIHPDYQADAELACDLLDWAESVARSRIDLAPADARVVMVSGAQESEDDLKQHLVDYGYTLVRHFLMMQIDMDAPPPAPVLPDGLRIVSLAEHDDIPALVHATSEAFRDHWGFVQEPFEQELADWRTWIDSLKNQNLFDPSLWFMAMDGDQIAGMSLCTPEMTEDRTKGYLDTLGVRRAWRRKGLGLALMHHTFTEFYRRGTKKVALHVDATSLTGATGLYEKAGMRQVRRYDDYELELRGGVDLRTQTVED